MKKFNITLLTSLLLLTSCVTASPSTPTSVVPSPSVTPSTSVVPSVSNSETPSTPETPLVQYLVKFVSNGGNSIQDMIYVVGDNVKLPTCVRTGYTFAGWYFDNETFLTKCNSFADISANTTLYAKWVVKSVKIYLDTYYEGEFEPIIKEVGETFYASELPTTIRPKRIGRLDYGFAGWKDAGENAPVDFVVKDQYYAFHSTYGIPTYDKSNILYQNTFDEDYGYLDKNHSWEKIKDWPVKNADTETKYRTPFINSPRGVTVSNGVLTVDASYSGLHYVNNGVYLPEVAYKNSNNYSIEVKVKFDKVLTSGDAKSNAYDSGFGIAVRQTEKKEFIAAMLDPNAKALRVAARNASNVGSGTDINSKVYYSLPSSYVSTDYHTIKVVVDGTGNNASLKAYYDNTLAYTYTDAVAGKNWLQTFNGNKIALFASGCTFVVDEISVKSVDETTTYYETDFNNYDTDNFLDGWKQNLSYNLSRSGDFSTSNGVLHINDAAEVSLYSHQMMHSPVNNFSSGIISFDLTVTDQGGRQWDDPNNAIQTKYFGLVLRAGGPSLSDYGVVMFRNYGRVQLIDHVGTAWGSYSATLQSNNDKTAFVPNQKYQITVVLDDTILMLFINNEFVSQVETAGTQAFRYDSGNIALFSNSINANVDNLVIAKLEGE